MTRRGDLAARLHEWCAGALEVLDPAGGWPSRGSLRVLSDSIPVDIFVSRVGLSHRDRDAVERRFQNPAGGVPIELSARLPLLLGVWYDDPIVDVPAPILVLADATRRARRVTRWSVFVALTTLTVAQERGWATQHSDSGELIVACRPELVSLAVETAQHGGLANDSRVHQAIEATGIADATLTADSLEQAQDRLRRTASVLVRDARFSGRVLEAYEHRCAMCGLGLGLVEAAHVYPVSAPKSNDRPSNGVALCANHHRAFDRHAVAINPRTGRIEFSPAIQSQAQHDPAVEAFIASTFVRLAEPSHIARFDLRMLEQRYLYYKDQYGWLS